jgi:hypothetical protein
VIGSAIAIGAATYAVRSAPPRGGGATIPAPSATAAPQVDTGTIANLRALHVPTTALTAPTAATAATTATVATATTVATLPAPAPDTAVDSRSSAPPIRPPRAESVSLGAEVRALDHAGAQLAAGDARRALDALDAHDRDFHEGPLAPEAAVLRIEALAAIGRDADAAVRARSFLASYPDGAQAQRVRSVLDAIGARSSRAARSADVHGTPGVVAPVR